MAFGRKFRNVVVLAKIETTKGTDATPTGATNAMLTVGDVSIMPIDAQMVPRKVVRGYFGSSGSLVGTTWMSASFSIELQSSGTAGTVPAWGALLRACAFAEVITATTRVDYTPISTALEGVTIYAYADGLQYKFLGAVGTFDGSAVVAGIPTLKFTFYAPYVVPTAVSNPTTTLTAWIDPLLVNDVNTSDLVLGGTYATGAITGGTPYTSGGVDFASGNQVSKLELIGARDVQVTDRSITGTVKSLDLTAAQEIAMQGYVTGGTIQSIGLVHGSVTGKKVLLFFPTARLLGMQPSNLEGVWVSDVKFEAPPSAGNDDMRIVAL